MNRARKIFLLLTILGIASVLGVIGVAAQDAETITIGDTVNGTLDEDNRRGVYVFAGEADQEVTITLTSDDFDAYLVLQDAAGEVLAEDDDSGGRLNAQIVYTLPESADYTIFATSLREYSSDGAFFQAGDFTLALEGDAAAQPPEPTPAQPTPTPDQSDQPDTPSGDAQPITIGETVEGVLESAEALFTFEGDVTQDVTVTVTSVAFDAFVRVLDPNGDVIAEDDDSGGRLNPAVSLELPETGTYTIVVTSFRAISSDGRDFATGDFTLRVSGAGGQTTQPTPEPTPSDGTLAYGDTVTGELETAAAAFTFDAAAGDAVTITLLSDEFDPYLRLLDVNGAVVAEDDDGAGSLNSQISTSLVDDGTYIIEVTSYRAVSSDGENFAVGAFTLSLALGDAPPVTQPGVTEFGGEISIGETVEGELSGSVGGLEYTFEAEAGDLISITMTSEDFDTYLLLSDANGLELQRDDDSAGNLDSRIGPYEITESGTYTITASSYGNIIGGEPVPGSFTLNVVAAQVDPIEYTQSVQGTITPESLVAVYRFSGAQGDIVSVNLDTVSGGVYARLTGGTTNLQTSGGTALLGPFTLPADGTYVITVTSYDTATEQPFVLTLNRIEPEPIVYGYRVRTSFEREGSDVLYYTFNGGVGDTVLVRVESFGAVDLRLQLVGPNGVEVASDDDSGPGFDPEINFQITEAGEYQLVVRPYIAGDDGTFNLYFENTSVPDLEAGTPQIVRLSDKQFVGTLVFDGTTGETIRLSARLLTSITSEPRITVTQNGVVLAEQSIGRVSSLLFEFVVPADGRIEITVQDFNGNPVVIEFTLERPAAE